jgi:hypothetical protein
VRPAARPGPALCTRDASNPSCSRAPWFRPASLDIVLPGPVLPAFARLRGRPPTALTGRRPPPLRTTKTSPRQLPPAAPPRGPGVLQNQRAGALPAVALPPRSRRGHAGQRRSR